MQTPSDAQNEVGFIFVILLDTRFAFWLQRRCLGTSVHHTSCAVLLQVLTSLPAALAGASEREVLSVAASAVARLYQGLGYIRYALAAPALGTC
jgi:hypothetical protein